MNNRLFFGLLRILRKVPFIRKIDFIDSFLIERVGELEDAYDANPDQLNVIISYYKKRLI